VKSGRYTLRCYTAAANHFYLFCYFLYIAVLLRTFKVLNGFLCADVSLRNYSLTHGTEWPFMCCCAMKKLLTAANQFLLITSNQCVIATDAQDQHLRMLDELLLLDIDVQCHLQKITEQ